MEVGDEDMNGSATKATLTIDDIYAARDAISDALPTIPFTHSRTLSEIAGAEVHVKFENLQFTSSFKERGAANRLLTLPDEAARRGVIAVSAGNHAQGFAFACQHFGVTGTVFMPVTTPQQKRT